MLLQFQCPNSRGCYCYRYCTSDDSGLYSFSNPFIITFLSFTAVLYLCSEVHVTVLYYTERTSGSNINTGNYDTASELILILIVIGAQQVGALREAWS